MGIRESMEKQQTDSQIKDLLMTIAGLRQFIGHITVLVQDGDYDEALELLEKEGE